MKYSVFYSFHGRPPHSIVSFDTIKEYWIDGQLAYHQKALERNAHKHQLSRKTAGMLLMASVMLFVIVLVFEFIPDMIMERSIFSDCVSRLFMHHAGQTFTLRSLLKIILGTISAGTFFLTNYFGKLSLERKSMDHEKMAALYQPQNTA